MPEVSSLIVSPEVVSELIAFENGTLGNHWNTVHVLRAFLEHAMPVDGQCSSCEFVAEIDDDPISQTHLCDANYCMTPRQGSI
jgi:hypothetical protein